MYRQPSDFGDRLDKLADADDQRIHYARRRLAN
jgi:hypothetical protein